jgi:hypothetical protein
VEARGRVIGPILVLMFVSHIASSLNCCLISPPLAFPLSPHPSHAGEHVCQEYTLRYIFVCSMFLTFYCLGVFAASEVRFFFVQFA